MFSCKYFFTDLAVALILRLIFKLHSKSQWPHLDGLGFKCGWQHVGEELDNYRQQEFHEGHDHEHQEVH